MPRNFLQRVIRLKVFYYTARQIQVSTAAFWYDHAPLVMDVVHQTVDSMHAAQDRPCWNKQSVALWKHNLQQTQQFCLQLEERASHPEVLYALQAASDHRDIDTQWQLLNEAPARGSVAYTVDVESCSARVSLERTQSATANRSHSLAAVC